MKFKLIYINVIKVIDLLKLILNELVNIIYINESRSIEVIFKYKNLYEDALWYLNN